MKIPIEIEIDEKLFFKHYREDLAKVTLPPSLRLQDEEPGFHTVSRLLSCTHPEHGAPRHLYVPAGQKFVHYCPHCRQKSTIWGMPEISC